MAGVNHKDFKEVLDKLHSRFLPTDEHVEQVYSITYYVQDGELRIEHLDGSRTHYI